MLNRFNNSLSEQDPAVYNIIENERVRQNEGLELIPSENFPSRAVLRALGSVMNNKYAEGYPHKRYYGGNIFIDQIENLAIDRCKQLFGCEHVNVQPYSGSPANVEVYFALLNFGDKIMGMSLAHGGHLTHGHKVNFTGKAYDICSYGVDRETGFINMDEVRKIAEEEQPKIIVSGATAYPRRFDFKEFAKIAKDVGAISMSDIAHIAGLVAGGQHPSPFPDTDIVTSTTHKTLRGPRGGMIMCKEQFAKPIDKAVFPGMQGGPHEHQISALAVALGEALHEDFKGYASQIVKNAKALAESLMSHGLNLVSGGTDNHLILADLTDKNVTGKEAEEALDIAGITVNKNMVPFDTRSPFDPSGIRMGTPALTSRGMVEDDMNYIGELISKAIEAHKDEQELKKIKEKVKELASRYPMYEDI